MLPHTVVGYRAAVWQKKYCVIPAVAMLSSLTLYIDSHDALLRPTVLPALMSAASNPRVEPTVSPHRHCPARCCSSLCSATYTCCCVISKTAHKVGVELIVSSYQTARICIYVSTHAGNVIPRKRCILHTVRGCRTVHWIHFLLCSTQFGCPALHTPRRAACVQITSLSVMHMMGPSGACLSIQFPSKHVTVV